MNDTSKSPPANSTQSDTDSLIDAATLDKTPENSMHVPVISSFNLTHAVLVVLSVLLLAQWWSSTKQISQVREELARRLQAADVSNTETRGIAKSLLETDKELQVKIGVLENKQAESENHALALEQLYQDLSKNRDEWALSEIEQVLSTASQQLQLAGNVQGALIALQNADARLARSDKPQFITVRRAIAHDIDRLKALPNLDLAGIALRLDSAISQIESIPLLVDENPMPVVGAAKRRDAVESDSVKKTSANDANFKTVSESGTAASWRQWWSERWHGWVTGMWNQISQLVRIRNVKNPDALLLTPNQGYFVKENVKLRLLNARLALLSRSETLFRSDIGAAQNEIAHYFDTRAKQTQTVQALLRQIQHSHISIEMPSLAESLNAVRNFTVKQ